MAEFASSPIIGIGFQTVSLTGSDSPNRRGNIEPGSSWLAVLSMTGIVGLCFVLIIFYRAWHVSKYVNNNNTILFQGLLLFMSIHMLVEGYIYAGGSFLCMLLWLIIGVSVDNRYIKHIE